MLEQTHFQHNDEKHGIEKKKKEKGRLGLGCYFHHIPQIEQWS